MTGKTPVIDTTLLPHPCPDATPGGKRRAHLPFCLPVVLLVVLGLVHDSATGQSFPQFDGGKSPSRGRTSLRNSATVLPPRTPRVRPSALSGGAGTRRLVPDEHPTIQGAIDASSDGDTVLVSEGTYFENIRYRGKAIVVGSRYLVDGDTAHVARTVIDGSKYSNPDSGSVVSLVDGEDTTSVLCGFTVQGGSGTAIDYGVWGRQGGGIFVDRAGARVVKNIITRNRIAGRTASGGALAVTWGTFLILDGNRITENSVLGDSLDGWGGYSGGVDIWHTSARVMGNLFERDTVLSPAYACGGAMCIYSVDTMSTYAAIVSGNVFHQNLADASNPVGIRLAYGGALYSQGLKNEIHLSGNALKGNVARGTTGGSGGGAFLLNSTSIVSGNDFSGNTSAGINDATAGGLLAGSTSFRLEGNRFYGNSCSGIGPWPNAGQGAGVFLFLDQGWGEQFIANNIFSGNSGSGPGGAFATWDGTAGGVPLTIVNNTFVDNTSTAGAGGVFFGNPIFVVFMNNIVWGNRYLGTWRQIDDLSSISQYYNNNIMGGWRKGGETIDADPGFEAGSYRLSDTSACIGAGLDSVLIQGAWYHAPHVDFAGSPRPSPPGADVDIGALENPRSIGSNKPPLVLSPRSVDFRNVRPRTTSDTLTVRIRNKGMVSKDLASFSFAGTEYRLAAEPRLPVRVRPLASLEVGLLFSPVAPGVSVSDTLRITTEDEQQAELTLPVIGRGSGPVRSVEAGTLFGLTSSQAGPVLYVLDKETGLARPIGAFSPSPPPSCTALAIRPRDSTLYAASTSLGGTDLYRLSPEFGDLDRAGTLPIGDVVSMAFSRADSLYLATGTGGLYRTSIGSTDAFLVGPISCPLAGLAFSPATGALWGSSHDSLFTIDPQNGNTALQGVNKSNAPHSSITFNGVGTLYGLYGDFLVSIDKGTGMPRIIGETKVPDLRWIAMRSDIVTGMEEEGGSPPPKWTLEQNFPNPYNAETVIRYRIRSEAHTTLKVYDLLGREVATLADEQQSAGLHKVRFDGSRLASGMYIYRLTSGPYTQCRKMLLMK
jgi:hypothetical protein